jgi:hypothetical protein
MLKPRAKLRADDPETRGVGAFGEGAAVLRNPSSGWYHTNRYDARAACEHCGGVIRHERWCITRNVSVQYAYDVLVDANRLTLTDRLILHALGVAWPQEPGMPSDVVPESVGQSSGFGKQKS